MKQSITINFNVFFCFNNNYNLLVYFCQQSLGLPLKKKCQSVLMIYRICQVQEKIKFLVKQSYSEITIFCFFGSQNFLNNISE